MKRIRPRPSGKKGLRSRSSSAPRPLSQLAIVPNADPSLVQCDMEGLKDMSGGPEFMQALRELHQNHPVRFYLLQSASLLEGLQVSLRLNKPLEKDLLEEIQAHLLHLERILRYCQDCPLRSWPEGTPAPAPAPQ